MILSRQLVEIRLSPLQGLGKDVRLSSRPIARRIGAQTNLWNGSHMTGSGQISQAGFAEIDFYLRLRGYNGRSIYPCGYARQPSMSNGQLQGGVNHRSSEGNFGCYLISAFIPASFLRPALRGHWARWSRKLSPRTTPPTRHWQGLQLPVSYRLRDSIFKVQKGALFILQRKNALCRMSQNQI